MPEGDSLHRIARRLQVLVGQRVEAESPNPRGLATGVARAVDGRVLEQAEAVGKNLFLRFDGNVVVRSHLRMNGRWRIRERGGPAQRGAPWLVLRTPEWEASQWNGPVLTIDRGRPPELGPDVLATTTSTVELVRRLRHAGPTRLVGEVLVDQRLLAGIGNMWLAEMLWQARISPWAPLVAVPDDRLASALDWVRDAMAGSVAGRRPPRAVYRRAGRSCRRCGDVVLSRGLGEANRTAYWCPTCQA